MGSAVEGEGDGAAAVEVQPVVVRWRLKRPLLGARDQRLRVDQRAPVPGDQADLHVVAGHQRDGRRLRWSSLSASVRLLIVPVPVALRMVLSLVARTSFQAEDPVQHAADPADGCYDGSAGRPLVPRLYSRAYACTQ